MFGVLCALCDVSADQLFAPLSVSVVVGNQVKHCMSVAVFDFGVRAVLQQHIHNVSTAVEAGLHQRRPVFVTRSVDVCLGLQQSCSNFRCFCIVNSTKAMVARRVWLGLVLNKQANDVQLLIFFQRVRTRCFSFKLASSVDGV